MFTHRLKLGLVHLDVVCTDTPIRILVCTRETFAEPEELQLELQAVHASWELSGSPRAFRGQGFIRLRKP